MTAPDPLDPWAGDATPAPAADIGTPPGPRVLPPPVLPPAPDSPGQTWAEAAAAAAAATD